MSSTPVRNLLGSVSSLTLIAIAACASPVTRSLEEQQKQTDDTPADEHEGTTTTVVDTGDAGGGPSSFGGCVKDPGNYDIPGDNCDNDDDGKVDNATACDTALSVQGNAGEFAKAMGLCKASSAAGQWGVVSAHYGDSYQSTTEPDAKHHGILPKFGANLTPTEGTALGVLSTGYAREYNTTSTSATSFRAGGSGLFGSPKTGTVPTGYPKPANGCTVATSVYDVTTARLEIRVPNNAKGLSFDFNFYTSEWPQFVCTSWNDGFLAFLKSSQFNAGVPENISFDVQNNPVSVNNGFFDRCTPNTTTCGAKATVSACSGGETELTGTGFFNKGAYCGSTTTTAGGATGWLTTKAPVKPGETITLEYMIWNTGDDAYQSSVLLDNFRWEPTEVAVATERPN